MRKLAPSRGSGNATCGLRRVALACTLAVVLTACSDLPSEVAPGAVDPGTTDQPADNGPDHSDGARASDHPTAAATPGDGATPARPGTEPDPGQGQQLPATTPAEDAGGVGGNGRAILRGDRASVVVEIDVQQGVTVDDVAVSHLLDTIRQVADKPGGVALTGGNAFVSDRTEWTAADLRSAVAANRTTATTDDQVSIHVLYVAGSHHHDGGGETEAIGLAFSASTIALFPDRWSGLGTLLGSSRAIERAVLVHELGHLLGLVNLTYTSDIAHEDPDHEGHSSNQGSVMHWAIESTLIGQFFTGPPPDRFDADDHADLEGLRTGKY